MGAGHRTVFREGRGPGLVLLGLILLWGVPARAQQAEPGSVSVKVTDYDNEDPIFQAEVRILVFARGTFSHRGFTDGGGRITFPGVARGNYIAEATHLDYEPAREEIDVVPGLTSNVFLRMRRKAEASAPPPRGAVTAAALAVPPEARKQYEEGVNKLKDDPAGSIVHLRNAVALYPKYAEAYSMLGLAYMREKKPEEAMAALNQAVELDPLSAFARVMRGRLHMEARALDRAEEDLLHAARIEPRAWSTHYELARCYFRQGKIEKSLEHARKAHDLPQAATATHLLLVDIYLRQGNQASALKELEEFVKADPKSPLVPRVQQKITELRRP